MDEEMLTVDQLREKRLKEIYLEAGKLKPDDPNFSKMLNTAKILEDIEATNDQNENNRLNNQAKNELDEERMIIESKKVTNDRWKTALDFGKILVGVAAGICINIGSYHMDETKNAYKSMQRFGSQMVEGLSKLTFWK